MHPAGALLNRREEREAHNILGIRQIDRLLRTARVLDVDVERETLVVVVDSFGDGPSVVADLGTIRLSTKQHLHARARHLYE